MYTYIYIIYICPRAYIQSTVHSYIRSHIHVIAYFEDTCTLVRFNTAGEAISEMMAIFLRLLSSKVNEAPGFNIAIGKPGSPVYIHTYIHTYVRTYCTCIHMHYPHTYIHLRTYIHLHQVPVHIKKIRIFLRVCAWTVCM